MFPKETPAMFTIDLSPASEAHPDDLLTLLACSYGAILTRDYFDDLVRAALPVLYQPVPAALRGPHYVLARRDGRVVGVGGWSRETPFGRPGVDGLGHVRHLAVSPDALRGGVGRAIFGWITATAQAAQVTRLVCLSPQGAVPFFVAMGMQAQGEVALQLTPHLSFPAVQMCWTG